MVSEKKASALAYDPSKDKAPRLVAKGSGSMASAIIGTARANNIEVLIEPELCELTSALPLYSEIPENLYTAIAGIFGMLMEAQKNTSPSITKKQ